MNNAEFQKLSKAEQQKIPFKDKPKGVKIITIVFLFTVFVIIPFTCYKGCSSSSTVGKSNGIDSLALELTAKHIGEGAVKQLLKSPSTAQFASEEQHFWFQPDSTITIKGGVDAQNSFGAMMRTPYYVKLKWKGDYTNFDNWVIIKSELEE